MPGARPPSPGPACRDARLIAARAMGGRYFGRKLARRS